MDRLDTRILRELMQGGTQWPARPGLISSYRFLARRFGVSAGTVRNRILEMNRTGLLGGTIVYPNVNLLGLKSGSYAIEVSPSLRKRDVIDRLAKVDGVVFFENFRGTLLGLGLAYEDEPGLKQMLARIDKIARASRGIFSRVHHPPFAGSLTVPEWGLLARLMEGNLRTYAQLARELKVSLRTLERRLAKLVQGGAFLTFPKVDLRALSGGVTAELLVAYVDPKEKAETQRRLVARIDDWVIYAGPWEAFESYRLLLPNVAVASELADEVARMAGVRFSRVELVDGLIDHLDRLRPYVERRLAAARAAGRAAPKPVRRDGLPRAT